MSVIVNYEFIPEKETAFIKREQDITSYAGRLLELVGSRTLVIGVDNHDKPFVLSSDGRLVNAFDPNNIDE